MNIVDCRGLDCPAPVIATKKALEGSSGNSFRVIVDNGAARENVLRFCNSRGCSVSEEPGESSTTITVTPLQPADLAENPAVSPSSPVILIASDRLGNGSDELGRLLLKNFLITLMDMKKMPEKILFINSGVLLTIEGSEVVEPLTRLANAGVEILSCGICLEFYHGKDKLVAGGVTNMYSIAEAMLDSQNTIRI